MSRFDMLSIVALAGCWFLTSSGVLLAQSDAETALKNARAAYAAEDFEQARDAAGKAAQTDGKNPDVFLLLGKSHFQLGELDHAMVAWRSVLKLAPSHEYARRMVTVLEGRASGADVRIQLATNMITNGLLPAAQTELQALRHQAALSNAQRQQVLMLMANIAVRSGRGESALALVTEVTSRNTTAANTLPVRIMTARAQLVIGGEFTRPALADLQKIAEVSAETPDGKVAALELLLYRLSHGENAIADVAAWIERNGTLAGAGRARVALFESVNGFLVRSIATPATENSELNEHDKSALAAAEQALIGFVDVPDQVSLTRSLTSHFEKRYARSHAYSAARGGLALIEKMNLPSAARELAVASGQRIAEAEATWHYTKLSRDVGEEIATPADLQRWISDHSGHPKEFEALRTLVFAYLDATRRHGVPRTDTKLSETDVRAIAVAEQLFQERKSSGDVAKVIETLKQHFQKHYFEQGAHAAAIAGMQGLLPLETPTKRGSLLLAISKMQTTVAINELKALVAAGTIPSGPTPMPASLKAAATTIAQICTDYPAVLSWSEHARLGQQVLEAAGAVRWPTVVTGPKAAHGWALDLALPVVTRTATAESVECARAVVERIVTDLAAVQQPGVAELATATHEKLLVMLPKEHDLWDDVVLRHVDLLTADALRLFDANVRLGMGTKNAIQTPTQQTILIMLSDLVKQRPAQATIALQKLKSHLKQWSIARHDAVVEKAYRSFAVDLPPNAQRRTQLAVAAMWFNQVLREHNEVMANGFQVPRQLDERSQNTLRRCYELAGKVGTNDPVRVDVSLLRKKIVDHYLALEYDDIAEAAIRVKAEVANAELDEGAELELAGLKRRLAERLLAKRLRQHDGRKQIVLTPAFNEAIAALRKFITDHPTSERVPTAANEVFVIARHFEHHGAWLIAAGIYENFEQFAAQVDSLKQAPPNQSTWPEKTAVARATALHTAAFQALQKWQSEKPDDALAPDQLSPEFQTAQAAWHRVIADYQQRPVAQIAITRSMSIATDYAALDAWDAADTVYATLLGLNLPLQSPERLEFGRAICQLGKVLPEHARAVLAALNMTRTTRGGVKDAGENGETMIALNGAELLSIRESRDPLGAVAAVNETVTGPVGGNSLNAEAPDAATASGEVGAMPSDEAQGSVAPAASRKPTSRMGGIGSGGIGGGGFGGGGFGGGGFGDERDFRSKADSQLMAAVRNQLDRQASQVAMMRDNAIRFAKGSGQKGSAGQAKIPMPGQPSGGQATLLSDAELQRQQTVLDSVYTALRDIGKKYVDSSTADQARDEIFVIVNHWREIAQWDRAATLARKFLTDNPTDINLPKIRQEVARDWLAWASLGVRDPKLDREELLTETARRFDTAREELQAIIVGFPDESAVRHQAQWDIATSFLTQARVVTSSSPTLARGQFVRAATELLRVAELFHDHPQIGTIPDMLWGISNELAAQSYRDEAITVWTELQIHYPTHKLADQSALKIAQTWQHLGQPLRAAEAYLELNFSRGGSDAALQNTIFQIAVGLKNEKRWIESLHVLQTFVDSFPSHANAGQSLTMIGQIHQANEVWEDAISAYRRVIDEFPVGAWTTEARWSIAECTINLSLWQEAAGAYADFQQSYPKDARVAEATRRIEVLKTLDRYQDVIDEEGQRKAFDAQFQVAVIVRTELANRVKAIIEYRKVEKNWPQSHLADDALFEIGKIYLELRETELARTALLQSAERYPKSPLADDALLLVGTSYVSEADQLAVVDRGKSKAMAKDIAQKQAYRLGQGNRRRQIERNLDQIAALKVQGKREEAANKEAYFAGQALQFDAANTLNASNWAAQQEEVLSAAQMADRQDKINAALRQAVGSFRRAASVNAADKADDALLQMAQIYDERLKDSVAAMSTWEEIVKQYSGTAVAEDASWKIARYYENQQEHLKAITAYQTFFRNYRRSPRAGQAQAAIAENHEHLGEWVEAMDAYANYVNNFPKGPLLKKAQEQINWIKTYRL